MNSIFKWKDPINYNSFVDIGVLNSEIFDLVNIASLKFMAQNLANFNVSKLE